MMTTTDIMCLCSSKWRPYFTTNRTKVIKKVPYDRTLPIPWQVTARPILEDMVRQPNKKFKIEDIVCFADDSHLYFIVFVNPVRYVIRKYITHPFIYFTHKRRTTALSKIYARVVPVIIFLISMAVIYAGGYLM